MGDPVDSAVAELRVKESIGYSIFMLVCIVFSLIIMVLLLLPLDEATIQALLFFDNAICVFFLVDFAVNLARSRPPRRYFIGQRGWLDLLGSIPTLGLFPASALFRLARISRLMRATPMLSGENRRTAHPRRAWQPGPVRAHDHDPGRVHGALGLDHPHGPVREPFGRTRTSRLAATRCGGPSPRSRPSGTATSIR